MATDDYHLLFGTCCELFDRVEFERPVRLLGVSVSGLESQAAPQQLYFDYYLAGRTTPGTNSQREP